MKRKRFLYMYMYYEVYIPIYHSRVYGKSLAGRNEKNNEQGIINYSESQLQPTGLHPRAVFLVKQVLFRDLLLRHGDST
jgi:hypothetical protein